MKVKKEIIVQNGISYEVIRIVSKSKSKEEIEFEQWSDVKFCLEAVKKDGYALQYVKEQTDTICLEAVKNNGYALQYVKEKKTFLKILKGGKTP